MIWFKDKIPTDLQILKEIYKNHEHEICRYSEDKAEKDTSVYIPIDIPKIATKFKTTDNMIFGRLYYSMERKYGYTKEDGLKVCLFTPVCGKERNCVNLPILISVISGLQQELSMFTKTLIVSVGGVLIAIASIWFNFSQSESNTQKDKEIVYTLKTITNDIQLKQKIESEKQDLYKQQLDKHVKYLCSSCHTSMG